LDEGGELSLLLATPFGSLIRACDGLEGIENLAYTAVFSATDEGDGTNLPSGCSCDDDRAPWVVQLSLVSSFCVSESIVGRKLWLSVYIIGLCILVINSCKTQQDSLPTGLLLGGIGHL
jgi:hypothetical protein